MITRLMATPDGVDGVWAELEDGSTYHLVGDDPAPKATMLRDWLDTNDVETVAYVAPEETIFDEVDLTNKRLQDAGFDITVSDAEQAADAKAFLAVHERTVLEEAAARFALTNKISID